MEANNTVFVGKKPTMSYVLAAITQLNQGSNEVVLKARGKAINKAVSVAELLRHRFIQGLVPKSITIGTEELQADGGKKFNVSTIEIVLGKP